jgi:hypothetical protein
VGVLRDTAVPYLRVIERQGRIFVMGIRPWTGAYVLQPGPPVDGPPRYELVRMS